MYISNTKVVTKLPNLISTIGDIPEETRVTTTPYGNKFYVYNFGYYYSNPLILPFDITLDVISYGNITLASNTVNTDVFVITSDYGSKFAITGSGTALLWYRYGKVDPATFDLIMNYALENNDYILVDGLLHTLSIQEAVSFILQNPAVQEMVLKGIDWQLNKIGLRDFLAYLNGGKYDVRQVALFLTIASYVFPCVFEYTSLPQFTGKPLQVYIQYLLYLSEYGQVVTSKLNELSEQSVYHQAEIDVLFEQTSELSEITAYHQSEIEELFSETAYHQSEIDELFAQTSYLSEQIVYHQSEIETLFSDVYYLSEQVDTQSIELAVLFVEDLLMRSEIAELSEQLESEQSEINNLSEQISSCCYNIFIVLGNIIDNLLAGVVQISGDVIRTVIKLIKHDVLLIQILLKLLLSLNINTSDITSIFSEMLTDDILMSSELINNVINTISNVVSNIESEIPININEITSEILNNLLR